MSSHDLLNIPINNLDGDPTTLGALNAKAILAVNVASKCGLTPQYATLEKLAQEYSDRGLVVVGFPCNQFMGQEPGTPDEIATFCSTTYGVTFPLMEKIEVNGENRHPIYEKLVQTADSEGEAGDIQWNFEKFLIDADGAVLKRFRSRTEPDAPEVVEAIESALG